MGWGESAFARQLPLADSYRLLIVDRRGFGHSPPTPRVDFESDARDIAALLDEIRDPAHLLGHSYGGVVCLLAAALRPAAVRSLAVIEPPAFGVARGRPEVEGLIERITQHYATQQHVPPAEFQAGFLRAWNLTASPAPQLSALEERAIRSSMGERFPWEAEIPFDALAALPCPKLVIAGAWNTAPPAARETAGAAFRAVCDVLVDRIGAQLAVFENATHSPQRLGAPFNDRLRAFWDATNQP
jgi:pimeloyl-ACP methyl ester carboxylesterase